MCSLTIGSRDEVCPYIYSTNIIAQARNVRADGNKAHTHIHTYTQTHTERMVYSTQSSFLAQVDESAMTGEAEENLKELANDAVLLASTPST